MTRLRSIAVIAGIGLVVTLSGCGNGPPEVAGAAGGGGATIGKAAPSGLGTPGKTVSATADLKFDPGSASVKTGAVIQWTNTGSVPHNVTFDSHPDLTSQNMAQGDTWQVQITVPGTYAYHCTIHPGMDGQLTVGG